MMKTLGRSMLALMLGLVGCTAEPEAEVSWPVVDRGAPTSPEVGRYFPADGVLELDDADAPAARTVELDGERHLIVDGMAELPERLPPETALHVGAGGDTTTWVLHPGDLTLRHVARPPELDDDLQ